MNETNPNNVVTDEVVFSYVKLWEPEPDDNGILKYSACLLLDKKNVAEKKKWDACVNAARLLGPKKKKFTKAIADAPGMLKLPIRDGDNEIKLGIKKPGQGYEGMWFMNVNARESDPPELTKPQGGRSIPILDRKEFYSGVIGRAIISFFPYGGDHGGKGVAVAINGALKTRDGERLDGRVNVTDAFAKYAAEAGDIEEVEVDTTDDEKDVFGDE